MAGGVPGGANSAASRAASISPPAATSSLWMPAAMNSASTPRPCAAARSVRSGVADREDAMAAAAPRRAAPRRAAALSHRRRDAACRPRTQARPGARTRRRCCRRTDSACRQRRPRGRDWRRRRAGPRHPLLDQRAVALHRLVGIVDEAGADDGLGLGERHASPGSAGIGGCRAWQGRCGAGAGSPSRRCARAQCRPRRRWRPRRRDARLVRSSTRSTPSAGTGALETSTTVPPRSRKRASAAPASAYASRPLCMTPHTSQNIAS